MFRWTIEYQQLTNHQSHTIKNASSCPLRDARNLHNLSERLGSLQAASDCGDLLRGWHYGIGSTVILRPKKRQLETQLYSSRGRVV